MQTQNVTKATTMARTLKAKRNHLYLFIDLSNANRRSSPKSVFEAR